MLVLWLFGSNEKYRTTWSLLILSLWKSANCFQIQGGLTFIGLKLTSGIFKDSDSYRAVNPIRQGYKKQLFNIV